MMKIIASVIGYLLTVYVVGQAWWYMWMFHGWVGTPKVLHKLTSADGERSYDMTLLEMLIISALVLGAIVGATLLVKGQGKGSKGL
jgi:hypothetical protein